MIGARPDSLRRDTQRANSSRPHAGRRDPTGSMAVKMKSAGSLALGVRLAALTAACLLAAGCGDKPAEEAPPPPPKVSVVTVGTQAVPVTAELPGRVTAMRVAEVRPQVSGIVEKRLFTEGSEVKVGQDDHRTSTFERAASGDAANFAGLLDGEGGPLAFQDEHIRV